MMKIMIVWAWKFVVFRGIELVLDKSDKNTVSREQQNKNIKKFESLAGMKRAKWRIINEFSRAIKNFCMWTHFKQTARVAVTDNSATVVHLKITFSMIQLTSLAPHLGFTFVRHILRFEFRECLEKLFSQPLIWVSSRGWQIRVD